MKTRRSFFYFIVTLFLLGPSILWARFIVSEPEDVRALQREVEDLEKRGSYQQIPVLLESLIADEPNVNEPLREAALKILADQLRLRKKSPDPLLKLMDLAMTEGWRYEIGRQYWVLVVELETTRVGRISQLVSLAEGGGFSPEDFGIRKWAARELCSMGAESTWLTIEAVFSGRRSTDLEDRAFCRSQLAALTSFSDPVDGLRNVLQSADPFANSIYLEGELQLWAVEKLDQIGTARSLHVLATYGARLATGGRWENSLEIAKRLRDHGWSDETIRLYGFTDSPPGRVR